MKTFLVGVVAAVAALTAAPFAAADGTEQLGPPSITIAQGTGFAVGGVGMQAFPNLARPLNVTVPNGATVKQVLLYWEGHWTDHAPHWSNVPQVDGDNAISVNGAPVTGTKIGGSTAFFEQFAGAVDGTEMFVTYRADITGRNLVGPGANSLTVSDMLFASNSPTGFPFNQGNDGIGILVVYDDGTDATVAGIRDGQDLAFANFPSPLNATVSQTFTFSPAPSLRPASLGTFAGSVAEPEFSGVRGNVIRGTFDTGQTFELVNAWQSVNGAQFDALSSPITIPANATSMTVRAFSEGLDLPASFAWIAATLAIQNPPRAGADGCTPGYWKNHDGSKKQTNQWAFTPYSPSQLISTVFNAGTLGSYTLRQALDWGGGSSLEAKKQLLLHHAVAALLNASHPDISYPLTAAEIIASVNAALASNDEDAILALKDSLDKKNNAGCPIGN